MMLRSDINRKLLVDKLCERWAVEKTAIELYDLAVGKAERARADPALIARLREIREQESQNERMLVEFIEGLGWSIDKETPSMLVALREGMGLIEVCQHPDSQLPHVLHALLASEMIDNAGWELLIELSAEAAVDEEALRRMRAALRHEKEHLHFVRAQLEKIEREELETPPPS